MKSRTKFVQMGANSRTILRASNPADPVAQIQHKTPIVSLVGPKFRGLTSLASRQKVDRVHMPFRIDADRTAEGVGKDTQNALPLLKEPAAIVGSWIIRVERTSPLSFNPVSATKKIPESGCKCLTSNCAVIRRTPSSGLRNGKAEAGLSGHVPAALRHETELSQLHVEALA